MHFRFSASICLVGISCLFIPTALFAQDYRQGYIIKNNKDSVSGFVEYATEKKNSSHCMFRASRQSQSVKFTPDELLRYGYYGDKQYESMVIPDAAITGKVFVKVLGNGPLRLYQYQKVFLAAKDSLILLPVPKSETMMTPEGRRSKEDSRYKGLLNFLVSDCKLSADKVRYTETDLTNLANNYNRCKGVEPTYKKPKPAFRANYNFFGGYLHSKMKVDSGPYVFNSSNTVVGGIGVDLSSPRIFDRIYLTIELTYAKNVYQSEYTTKISGSTIHNDVRLTTTYLKLPLGLRYNFLREQNTPYIKGGLLISNLIDSSFETVREEASPSGIVVTSTSTSGSDVWDEPIGYWIGVGYNKRIMSKLQIYTEIRYDSGSGAIGNKVQSESSTKNYSLLLGLRF